MTADLKSVMSLLEEIKEAVLLQNTYRTNAKDVMVVTGLSDITERLGLVQAGEFRTGNSKDPGKGFTGVRIAYPAMIYSGGSWHFVGINNDVLQVGINATDGKLYAGAGAVILSSDGIIIKTDSGAYLTFQEADGTEVATIKQDGAGNLQIDLADATKALTINDGNLIVNHATGVSGTIELRENNVLMAHLGWDATNDNLNVENDTSGSDIFFILKGGNTSTEFWRWYDRTAAVDRARLTHQSLLELRAQSSVPTTPASGYGGLWMHSQNRSHPHWVDDAGNDRQVALDAHQHNSTADDTAFFEPALVDGNRFVFSVIANGGEWFLGVCTYNGITQIAQNGSFAIVAGGGTLTGTTGTDGTINLRDSNGVLYVENRIGASRNIGVALWGHD